MSQSLSSTGTKSLSLPPCIFSCRIVQIDYYLSAPLKNLDVCFSGFRASPLEKVPVLRVFGATPGGQKTCLHIHGAFPYLLVPCVVADPAESYLQQLARSIDHALQVSLGASSRSVIHVFKIVPVKGM
jgi:DNA polymerase zeta